MSVEYRHHAFRGAMFALDAALLNASLDALLNAFLDGFVDGFLSGGAADFGFRLEHFSESVDGEGVRGNPRLSSVVAVFSDFGFRFWG